MLKKALGWIFVTDAMQEAQQRLRDDEASRGGALQQARLLAEIASRVAEPAEPLPPGNRAPVTLQLVRDGVAFVLAPTKGDMTKGDVTTAPELAVAWESAPEETLRAAEPQPARLAAVKATLLTATPAASSPTPSSHDPAEAVSDPVSEARAFLDRLLWNADAPRRRVESLLIRRWLRVVACAAVLVLLGAGARTLLHGSNLVEGKPFTVSSTWPGCATDPMCDGLLLCHTNNENDPWAEYDLLKPTAVHQVEVTNRPDCCGDRTIPLIIEVSTDHKQWTEVARRTEAFTVWTAKFPRATARYIRFRIPRVSILNLKAIDVR
ncbi:MAG TPA: discoidin domain-containing protein [Polyangia bacterium]|jgi:hypothetical protein